MGLFDKLRVPSQKKFARLVIRGLREAGETRAIEYEQDRFRLVIAGKPLPLANFHRDFCAATPDQQQNIIRRAVSTCRIEPPPTPAEFDARSMLPLLWPRSFIELAALQQEDGESTAPWPHQIVGARLAAGVARPTSAGLQPLTHAELRSSGLSWNDAWEMALGNLEQRNKDAWRRAAEGYWECESRDGSASARLLRIEEIASLALRGGPVVLAPHRDLLLAAGADDPAALAALAERARSAFDHPQAVSGATLRLEENAWRPWLPAVDHPAYAALKLLDLESQGRDYLQQKRFLDMLGRKAETPLCLASFSATTDPHTQQPRSFTVWPAGLEILLPEADEVVFFQPDATGGGEVVARGPWDSVRRNMGELMQELDLYPPRFLVREFPNTEQLCDLVTDGDG